MSKIDHIAIRPQHWTYIDDHRVVIVPVKFQLILQIFEYSIIILSWKYKLLQVHKKAYSQRGFVYRYHFQYVQSMKTQKVQGGLKNSLRSLI